MVLPGTVCYHATRLARDVMVREAMVGPFPGMDPYLEDPAEWPDVHGRLITAISEALAARVAPDYVVRIEQRVYIVGAGDPGRQVTLCAR